jgi:hypothetical protein
MSTRILVGQLTQVAKQRRIIGLGYDGQGDNKTMSFNTTKTDHEIQSD